MREILRPGGCAYNVAPTGEKAERLKKLRATYTDVIALIEKRRSEIAKSETT